MKTQNPKLKIQNRICHCERPKGAKQSHEFLFMRLLRHFVPRNDSLRGFVSRVLIISLALLNTSPTFAAPPKVGPYPPLVYDPPEPNRVILKNGVIVYLLEDHELPIFSLNLLMRTSPGDIPYGKEGVMTFMGEVWRIGGTKLRTPDELNQELEFMPATLETNAGEESADISLSCLSGNIDKALAIFADVLQNPVFREDQLQLVKDNTMESLRRKNETPQAIARRAFRDVVYGPDHIYARDMTPERVRKVKRSDLMKMHSKVVVPDYAMIAVSGDFTSDEVVQKLNLLFRDWVPLKRVVPEYDYAITIAPKERLFYVEKVFNQSRIFIGNVGLSSRHDPDIFPLGIANYILGGGGPSRLFAEIRSRLGLAYLIGSFYTDSKGPGLVGIGCQTKVQATIQTLEAIENEVDKFVKDRPSREELHLAQDAMVNTFVFRFESTHNIVNEKMHLEYYGYPKNYLETYLDKIKMVTEEDVLRVARKYLSKEKRKILVVGDQNKFDAPLSRLGPVTEIPLEKID